MLFTVFNRPFLRIRRKGQIISMGFVILYIFGKSERFSENLKVNKVSIIILILVTNKIINTILSNIIL